METEIDLYRKKLVLKYFNKISKLKVTNLRKVDDLSFTFNLNGTDKYIEYNISSECMIINDGNSINENDAREIGYYEINELKS